MTRACARSQDLLPIVNSPECWIASEYLSIWRTIVVPLLHHRRTHLVPQQEIELDSDQLVAISPQSQFWHLQGQQSNFFNFALSLLRNFPLKDLVVLSIRECTLMECRRWARAPLGVIRRPNGVADVCELKLQGFKFVSRAAPSFTLPRILWPRYFFYYSKDTNAKVRRLFAEDCTRPSSLHTFAAQDSFVPFSRFRAHWNEHRRALPIETYLFPTLTQHLIINSLFILLLSTLVLKVWIS